jgi:hypothetical protein
MADYVPVGDIAKALAFVRRHEETHSFGAPWYILTVKAICASEPKMGIIIPYLGIFVKIS